MPKKTEYAQGTPDWVDLQTTDQNAAKQFYSSLFGWSYDDQPMPGDGGVYSMATLNGETVAAIAPMPPGAPAGMPPMWNTYLAVDDVDAAVDKVGLRGRAGADAGHRHRGYRPDGVRGRSDRRRGGAVAGQSAHRRDTGQRARGGHLERIDHGQAGFGVGVL